MSIDRDGTQPARKPKPAKDLTLNGLSVRRLDFSDIPALMDLSYASAVETNVTERFSARHSRVHFAGLLARGFGFGVCEGERLIGMAIFTPIETAIAMLEDMESAHIFIHPDCRSLQVARVLFGAIRDHANATGRTMLIHQIAYFDALAGRTLQTQRVEKLYKRMSFDGSYAITYACRPDKDAPPQA